jgi:hypothetical protein
MDSVNPNYDDFFVKGFVTGKFFTDISKFSKYKFSDANDPNVGEEDSIPKEASSDLLELQLLIGQEYINKLFGRNYTLKNKGMWEGVDEGSSEWHNDWEDGKNMNTNLLVYLDDTTEHSNSIQVKNGFDEYVILPKAGDFVWLNQGKGFQHKASHNGGRRRVLSFEYFTDGIK